MAARAPAVRCGEWGEQGKRPSMEDATVASRTLRPARCDGTYTLHAVFDGHGGDEAARYADEHLPGLVETLLADEKPEDALTHAFERCDADFIASTRSHAGCTAVVALLHHETRVMWVANAGDSRAVIGMKDGRQYEMSDDHRAGSNDEEVARVRAAGGFVIRGRVMGELAVTRALGDKEFKEEAPDVVLATPEILRRQLTDEDHVLIIACDGVFDVLHNLDAIARVQKVLAAGGSAEDAAKDLVKHSIEELGSTDNASAVVVTLDALA